MRPVASHTSAQSRLSRMQRVSDLGSSSPRQASAQAVQLWAQSKQASIHSTSVEASTAAELGLVWSICWAWVTKISLLLCAGQGEYEWAERPSHYPLS